MNAKKLSSVLTVGLVVAMLAALYLLFVAGGGTRTVTAEFPRTVALYKGSDVRILGIPVGKVESVEPSGTKVIVNMSYDDQYKVPADAKAAVILPAIVGDRYVQLTPVYRGGAVMKDRAKLGLDRTATPLELDEIFGSINSLTKALGPDGVNASANGVGALTRLLRSTAANFGGQGEQFNTTLQNLGKLTRTLANNKDELFGTVTEVEKFVNTLAKNDTTVRRFNDSLASGSDLLAGERQELAATIRNLGTALTVVRTFVKDNKALLGTNIDKLNRVSKTLVKRRAALDETLKLAPAALNNLALTYNASSGTLDTRTNLGENLDRLVSDPAQVLCSIVARAPGGKDACASITAGLPAANLPLPRTAPGRLAAARAQLRGTMHVVEPIDRSLGGLVEVAR